MSRTSKVVGLALRIRVNALVSYSGASLFRILCIRTAV